MSAYLGIINLAWRGLLTGAAKDWTDQRSLEVEIIAVIFGRPKKCFTALAKEIPAHEEKAEWLTAGRWLVWERTLKKLLMGKDDTEFVQHLRTQVVRHVPQEYSPWVFGHRNDEAAIVSGKKRFECQMRPRMEQRIS